MFYTDFVWLICHIKIYLSGILPESNKNRKDDYVKRRKPLQEEILYQLMNQEKNRELLASVPHIPYLDLAIIFYYYDKDEAGSSIGVIISNEEVRQWGWTVQWMEEQAAVNTPASLPGIFQSMEEMIEEISPEDILPEEEPVIPMHVLTNRSKLFGAACILYPGVLSAISKSFQDNLYILPSSVHECIIVPMSGPYTQKELEDIVMEVNESQVPEEEFLSNRVYCYEREEDSLSF